MSRTALLAVSLTFLLTPSSRAQDLVSSSLQQASGPQEMTAVPQESPGQLLELRGDIFVARKMYPEAIGIYQKLASEKPKNAALLNKIGVAYQQLGDYDRAQHFYKRSLKADKTFSTALNNLGTIEYARKRFRKAARYYRQAIALHPDAATYYSNLGYASYGDKKFEDAMQAFTRATSLDPGIFEHKGGAGAVVQQRSMADPGMFYFLLAKTYALEGDAEHCAHFLTISRDEGYKNFSSALKDPAFAKVINDPQVQAVFQAVPSVGQEPRGQS
jgi:tetratricopeptide (TPR) repeat protein